MIPPARIVQRISSKPAASILRRQRAAGRGSCAPTRAGRCRRRGRRRPCRAAARAGRTRARRRSRAAGGCGWVISRITSRPPGRSTRAISREPAVEVGEVAGAEADRDRVEAARRRRAASSASAHSNSTSRRRAPPPSRAPARASARRSRSRRRCRRGRPAAQLERQVAGAAADVERGVARARRSARSAARSRHRWCEPGGHRRVHQVVDARRCGRTCRGPRRRTPRSRARARAGLAVCGAQTSSLERSRRLLVERGEEVGQLVELLRRQVARRRA